MNLRNIGNRTNKIKCLQMGEGYFAAYTGLFAVVSLFVFSWYFFTGRTLIYKGDGWAQHYRALVYYAKYLRSIIKNLALEHHLIIPSWDFCLGEGNDILATLHYYVIGDPFSVLSVLVPVRYMYIYYNMMILLRLYLAGIAFSCLCFQCRNKNSYAVLAGAMAYVFCFWGMFNAARHPFFLNPMLYFPMIILGIEKVLNRERPYLFTIAVFLSAISNFYFFYMIVLLTIIYVIARVFCYYHSKILLVVLMLFKIGVLALIGVMLGAIVFLPICYVFLNDSRMSGDIRFHLIYPLSYYSKLPSLFITEGTSYWMCMGYAAPVLPAVFLLFYKRGMYKLLKGLFGVCVLISVIPAFGQILNGFSYMANRWSWAFSLLVAYILTIMWPSLMELNIKESIFLFICTIGYFLTCLMLEYSRTTNVFISIGFVFIFLFLLIPVGDKTSFFYGKMKQQLAIMLVFVSILNNSFWKNADGGDGYASEGMEVWEVLENLRTNEASAVINVAESEGANAFYRYSGRRNMTKNAGMSVGVSSTQYYWSLANPYISMFRERTGQIENISYNYRGYDDRTALITLASVRYYVIPDKDNGPIPYGFTYVDTIDVGKNATNEMLKTLKNELQVEDLTKEQIKVIENATQSKYKVYHNEFPLPLAYSYDGFISTDAWETLSMVGRQEALLSAIVLDDCNLDLQKNVLELENRDLDYMITCNGSGISLQDDAFVVTSANAAITLTFDGLSDCETYFSIEGLSFQGVPVYDLYFGDNEVEPLNLYNQTNWERLIYTKQEDISKRKLFWKDPTETKLILESPAGVSKTLTYYTNDNSLYDGRHNFTVNLGYSQSAITSITVKFSEVGIYKFDDISITCQPMSSYEQRIAELNEDTFREIEVGTDMISGEIVLKKPRFICFSIPYSKGWSAYVDGEKTNLYRANIKNIALAVNEGSHNIMLIYETPVLREGIFISIISTLLFICFVIFSECKRKYDREEKRL